MAERAGVGTGSGAHSVVLFEYPAAPWVAGETGAGSSEIFVEVFPGVASEDRERGAGMGSHSTGGETPGSDCKGLDRRGIGPEEMARILGDENLRAEERGLGRGVEIGIAQAQEKAAGLMAAEHARLHEQALNLVESFCLSRDQYLHELEQETVRLALAIAARILRREAQTDPLLLTGAVRVALGQLADSTTARIRVPQQDKSMWEEALALIPRLALRPLVVGEECMELGECRLETELGRADLGLLTQLKEIERGFFDRVGSLDRGPVSEEKLPSPVRTPGDTGERDGKSSRYAWETGSVPDSEESLLVRAGVSN